MLVELVAQPHCLYLLCTEAIKYVYTYLNVNGDFLSGRRTVLAILLYAQLIHHT